MLESRKLKAFRFPPAALTALSTEAAKHDVTQTEIVNRGIALAIAELNRKESETTQPHN